MTQKRFTLTQLSLVIVTACLASNINAEEKKNLHQAACCCVFQSNE